MACSTDFIDYVCAQLQGAGVIRARRMFGDWCIYVDEKAAVLACDNLCYVKMHPAIAHLMHDAPTGRPYEGAKEHYILDIDHPAEATAVVKALLPALPYPKRKK